MLNFPQEYKLAKNQNQNKEEKNNNNYLCSSIILSYTLKTLFSNFIKFLIFIWQKIVSKYWIELKGATKKNPAV